MLLKKLALAAFLLSAPAALSLPSSPVEGNPAIIPLPATLSIEKDKPGFLIDNNLPILKTGNKACLSSFLTGFSNNIHQIKAVPVQNANNAVQILLKKNSSLSPEWYSIKATTQGITISCTSPAGAFYAAQTLKQSLTKDAAGKWAIPCMTITDSPRFTWRGIMIDSGRNPRSIEELKTIIDLLAHYKVNTIHWHLTEDQGWRLEIKKYPKLTSIGATRPESPMPGNRNKGDGKPFTFFYTQKEVKELVDYAKRRHITIVPEIETPGHAAAAITAYPEFGNKDIPGYKPRVATRWGILPFTFSPTEPTFKFIDGILEEVCQLFPDSPYIHIGGDEAPKQQWKNSPQAQEVMKKNGLKNEQELQSYFIHRVEKLVNACGKQIIGWDEIREGGLSKTATLMVWHDPGIAREAIRHGNKVIMTPFESTYLIRQEGPHPEGPEYEMATFSTIPLQKVYNMNPIPKGLTPEQEKNILGVQGSCWSEYMTTLAKWQYMVFPRMFAIAELGWTQPDRKDFTDFKRRLDRHKPFLDALKINYRTDSGEPAQPDAKMIRE
ncbi:beta-N-acetylhexosaminidase [uncultured Akkermansia sp.]|uniref:beta-N-acetylhexosaminidase n=1 Tax=Akkermansia sp. TaxID=1872421 RepID=UPI0025ED9416|nr:beta-N-acetylhexosaminidase [uncultured Akkermansia sp.]